MRPEQRAFADGREPAAADVSPRALCQIRRRQEGELDPFAVAVMAELGQDISGHRPITFEELDDWEGLNFDLIITLSPEAHHKALELTRTHAADVEYWPTQDPTGAEGIASRSCKPIAKSATPVAAHPQAVFKGRGGEWVMKLAMRLIFHMSSLGKHCFRRDDEG